MITKISGIVAISFDDVTISFPHGSIHYCFYDENVNIGCNHPLLKRIEQLIGDPSGVQELLEIEAKFKHNFENAMNRHYYYDNNPHSHRYWYYRCDIINFCPRNIDEELKHYDEKIQKSIIMHQLVGHLMSPILTTKSARR